MPIMRPRIRTLLPILALALLASILPPRAAAAEKGREILFWSPFSAGTTEQAAATMDAFARYVEKGAGWPAGSAAAGYDNTVEGGRQAVDAAPPGFLIVPVPIFLRYHDTYRWQPLRFVVTDSGDAQRYSVFGPPGSSLASLAGAPLEGETAYDPAFVAGVVLGKGAGEIELQLRATARTLSAVRRAAKGEPVAVLLDEEQRKALDTLPQGTGLQMLAESIWMPAGILVAGPAAAPADVKALLKALDKPPKDAAAADLLKTMRIRRFEKVAGDLLATLEGQYSKADRRPAPSS